MDKENISVSKLLLKMSPPVMLALLIQSIYNNADSFFVAKYSAEGLTALSIVYPVQLLITALATGTGAGVNIMISRLDGRGETETQHDIIKSGMFLNMFHFIIFAFVGNILANAYFSLSTGNAVVKEQGILYSRIIFSGSLGLFTESVCTKILQARGNMMLPMIAQVQRTPERDDFYHLMNGKFCGEAWDAISRYVYTALQGGSIMHKWTNDERMMITCCNDGTRPVIFKIERIDIPENDEEKQWLEKQNFRNTVEDAYTG